MLLAALLIASCGGSGGGGDSAVEPGAGVGNDTTPPTAPSALALSGLTCNSATLTWAASSDNVAVTGYEAMRGNQSLAQLSGDARSIALTLVPGSSWVLSLSARDAAGNQSGPSELQVNVPSCPVDTQPPSSPTNLRATPAARSVDLIWNASTDNVGVVAYEIYRDNASVGRTSGALQFTDGNLQPGTLYSYQVLALDARDNASARSTSRAVTTLSVTPPPDKTPPSAPSALVLSALTCNSATLSWTGSTDNVGVSFYDVYRDGQLLRTVSGNLTTANLTLVEGANWGFYVNARDAAGNVSDPSATLRQQIPFCQTDTQPPTAPSNLQASVNGTSVTLSWTAATDNVAVTAYDVFRGSAKAGSTSNLQFTDTGLAAATVYRYTVVARDAQNNLSPASAPRDVTTAGGCTNAICSTTQIAQEADLPWGLVTLPNGDIIYSRRDRKDLVRMTPGGVKTVLGTVPNVQGTDGEGGLLGLAVTRNFPDTDSWIYVYHTSPTDNRIVRVRYNGSTIDTTTLQTLLTGIRKNKFHNGGRLRFSPDDSKLFATTGDAQNGNYAQDTSALEGKVLRINPDGTIPSDNPFGNAVWSYGHRNPQGLAFDSQGQLWEQEFGDSTMDETNLIVKGANYGWPACEGTSGSCSNSSFTAPKYTYATSAGSCSGIAIVGNALFVACLRGERLYRHVISGSSLTGTQQLLQSTYGRLRTVEPSRDGGLWLTTSNGGDKDNVADNSDNRILKIVLGP